MSRPDHYGNPAGLTQDIAVVRAIYAAFNARDVEAVLPHLAPDCELDLRGTAAVIGREGPYRATTACVSTSPTPSAPGRS